MRHQGRPDQRQSPQLPDKMTSLQQRLADARYEPIYQIAAQDPTDLQTLIEGRTNRHILKIPDAESNLGPSRQLLMWTI